MRSSIIISAILGALVMTSCVAGDGSYASDPANFLSGLWHGWIAFVMLFVSLIPGCGHIDIYERANNGWWYDFGFLLGIAILFSGGSTTAVRHSTPSSSGDSEG